MDSTNDTRFDRRELLRKAAAATVGLGGLGGVAAANRQDGDDGQPLISRRFVMQYPDRLDAQQEGQAAANRASDLVGKIILVTDRQDKYPDQLDIDEDRVADCIDGWAADELEEWEAIVVDWRNASQFIGGGVPERVRATQLVELSSLVANPRPDPIPLGTPFLVGAAQECPGDLVGVTASQVPGLRIVTGPGVSTGEGNSS